MPAVTRRLTMSDSPASVAFDTPPQRTKSSRVLATPLSSSPTAASHVKARPLCPAKIVASAPDDSPSTRPRRTGKPSVRSILKPTPTQILVAKSAVEGTWNNREAARRVVAGDKPVPFYSAMVLAELCDGAEDGVSGKMPSDDDIIDSDELIEDKAPTSDSSEEEEEVECIHPSSLVGVILDGAEDLLTLEEAYTSLALRVREVMFHMGPPTMSMQLKFDSVWLPIADEAPAVIRAIQRDLHRLMGRVPCAEANPNSSPFRGIPAPLNNGLPPSPSKSPKKGYTEAEVLYRREAAGVGSAVLRLLAIVFSHHRLYSCFSDADVQSLLDQVLVIMRSPGLPTPNAKRTYTLTVAILSNINLPPAWVRPFEKKLVSAIERGMTSVGSGQFAIKDPAAIRREAFNAAANLLKRYPSMMFPHYQALLPLCLRAFYSPSKAFKRCGVAVAVMFVNAKLQMIEEADAIAATDKFEWNKLRSIINKSETCVANFLKGFLYDSSGRIAVKEKTGDRSTEGNSIAAAFRATIGETAHVAWACTAWAVLASLLGHAYNTSPQASEIDHIMDRSLWVSTNTVRPTLATAAWMHGVYAYLQAGASLSVTDNGQLVRSYSPFVASSYQDVTARLQTITAPARFSLGEALNPANATRALIARSEFNNEQRWSWRRAEKTRKYAWMVSTGKSTTSLVYAYTVVALAHEDAPAAETSRMSGILSSDGAAPDSTPDERRLPRLDRTFSLVLNPFLQQMFAICGVDEIMTTGWEIFAAITNGSSTRVPSLDRLLSKRLLSGDILGLDEVIPQVVARFERERISPDEIPGWGKLWVAKRLGKLLTLFESAFDGIRGINDLGSVEWVTNSDGLVLLPKVLSDVWSNLLQAVAFADTPGTPNPLYVLGLRAATRTMIGIFDRDPAAYIPICLLNASGKSVLEPHAIRLGITLHLYNVAVEILGQATLGRVRIDLKVPGLEEDAFATDPIGHPTVTGHLLGHLVSYKHFPSALDPKVIPLFTAFISSLFDSGCSRDLGTTLLGDLTNKIPFIFEGCEQLQLDVWRLLALKWSSVVDLEPAEVASATNHTGGLLTTLLSCPFRNTSADSTWYNKVSLQDLEAWEGLLKVTVLRFRAKRAGSNLGVMETLAAHLGDFLRIDDDDCGEETRKRRSCDTTLHCLAEAAAWVALVQKEHYHADHYNINENYVPVDFLALVSSALVDAYAAETVPHKVTDVVENLTALLSDLPEDAVAEVVEALRPGLAIWMADSNRRASPRLGEKLDTLYVALFDDITRAIESRAIPALSETMDKYIELYAPRLSRASSAAVPAAFQQLWHRAFQPLGAVQYSDDVAGFLSDIMTAIPGFIIAEGLSSLESSESVYPHAAAVAPLQGPAAPGQMDHATDETEIMVPETTTPASPKFVADDATNYDADVSQSPSKRPKRNHQEIVPQSSSPAEADVFGPKSNASGRRRKPRRAVRAENDLPSASSTPGLGDTTVIAETPQDTDEEDDTPSRPTRPVAESPSDRPSLFTSASRWLRRVPSMLSFASSDDLDLPGASDGDDSPAVPRTRRKRRRTDSREREPSVIVDSTDVVDLTQDSPEPQPQPPIVLERASPVSSKMPTCAQPTPRTRLARQRSLAGTQSKTRLSRSTTPVNAASEPVMTRSAARQRESQEDTESSQRKSKRRRRTRSSPASSDDESRAPKTTAQARRAEEDAISKAETDLRTKEKKATDRRAKEAKAKDLVKREKEERAREDRERREAERIRVETEEREAREQMEKEEAERAEAERVDKERREAERIETERIEAERIEAARVEAARVEAARVEAERIEAERIEAERIEAERVEAARVEAERIENERIENERLALERLEQERAEQARLARQREEERIERERLERERLEKERLEEERLEKERLIAERLEEKRLEKERLEKERLEQERLARLEAERQERLARLAEFEREAKERKERVERAERERQEERERMEAMEREHAEKEEAARQRLAKRTKKGKGKQKAAESSQEEPSQEEPSQPEISGRFDDAPGDFTPRSTRQSTRRGLATPPKAAAAEPSSTPIKRSTRQMRVLDMVEEAVKHEDAIAGMDMDAVIELMGNIEKLRTAATSKLQEHAVAGREERRRRRARE